MDESEPSSRKRERHWIRALRPLLWWLILVFLLFVYHTHERLLERTRIKFTVDLEGKPVGTEASVSLDGRRVESGERIPLGRHEFAVSHPKAERISTNMFIWYGEHDMGTIDLKRAKGVLALKVEPPAARLSVVGPEFSVTLTNSAGVTSSIPTDVYRVDAHWANHDETKQVVVNAGPVNSLRLAPLLGAMTVESSPSGARVIRRDGWNMGATPLRVAELSSGLWQGEIRLDGYIPVPVSLYIVTSETNSFRTNLVNWQFSQAIESAKSYLAAGNANGALEALSAALRAKPNDPEATGLQEKATALQKQNAVANHLRQAEEMMTAKNYTGVRSEANAVLQIVPDNERALAFMNQLVTLEKESKEQAKAQAEARRQERLALPKKSLEFAVKKCPEASLFEEHEIQTDLSGIQAQNAIERELETAPAFKVVKIKVSAPEAFVLDARQEVPGGLRDCVIAGAQIGDKETHIIYKVLEYKKKTGVTFQGQLKVTTSFVHLDPSRMDELSEREKAQIKDGEAMLEERIRRAVAHVQRGNQ
jgi:hypothetical protein